MTYVSHERLCLNADRSAVVDCESPEASFLLVGPGGSLTDEQARKYGLLGKAAESETEAKAVEPAQNKARKPSENKAGVTDAPAPTDQPPAEPEPVAPAEAEVPTE